MKKTVLVLILLAVISAGAFADHPGGFGIGVVGGYSGAWGAGKGYSHYGLSLKVPSIPIYWAVNMHITDDVFSFGLTGDKYILDNKLVPDINLNWFIGVGGWGGITISKELALSIGLRVPIGLSWQPLPLLEIFLDIAPSLGLAINPLDFPAGGWPIELGLRFWL